MYSRQRSFQTSVISTHLFFRTTHFGILCTDNESNPRFYLFTFLVTKKNSATRFCLSRTVIDAHFRKQPDDNNLYDGKYKMTVQIRVSEYI